MPLSRGYALGRRTGTEMDPVHGASKDRMKAEESSPGKEPGEGASESSKSGPVVGDILAAS